MTATPRLSDGDHEVEAAAGGGRGGRGRGLLAAIWTVAGLVVAGLAVFVGRHLASGAAGQGMGGMAGMGGTHDASSSLFAAGGQVRGTSLLGPQFFTAWQLDSTAVAFVVVLAAVYAAGVVTLRRRHGTTWPIGKFAAFGIGLLAIVFATCGSIAVYDRTLFSAHMIGHLVLVMLAPALLAGGGPLALWRASRRDPARFDRVMRGPVLAVLTSPPVALACYTVVIVGTHLTGLMDAIMASTALGQLEHLAYLVVGWQFFSLVVGDEPLRWRLSLLGRLGLLGIAMAVDTFTGVVLLMATVPISMGVGVDALSDTRTGGAIMWVGGDGLMAVIMVGLVLAYLRRPLAGRREERSWVEQARRGVFEANTAATSSVDRRADGVATVPDATVPDETGGGQSDATDSDPDFDEDERRRLAYNRWLADLERR